MFLIIYSFYLNTCRPGKSVQCSSDPEFTFSNVPRKYVKTMGKFEGALCVHYHQRIIFQLRNILKVWNSIMLFETFVRKQNNLQILLKWKIWKTLHNLVWRITEYDSLKYTWKTQNVPQFSKCSSGSRDPTFFHVWLHVIYVNMLVIMYVHKYKVLLVGYKFLLTWFLLTLGV